MIKSLRPLIYKHFAETVETFEWSSNNTDLLNDQLTAIIIKFHGQLSQYLEKYLNSLLCSFRKAHSLQHALFKLLHAWQKELDKSGFVGAILMNLSEAFDSLSHMIFLLPNLNPMLLIKMD